mgnify:CR=1 FL=1
MFGGLKVYAVLGAVILALSGVTWYAIERAMDAEATVRGKEQSLRQLQSQLENARSTIQQQRQAENSMQARIADLSKARSRIERDLAQSRKTREQLEQENEQFRAWADGRLPDPLIRLFQQPGDVHPTVNPGSVSEPGGDSATGSASEPAEPNPQ